MKNQYDYIIIGSGLAGLYASYCASEHGSVALLTKSGLTASNSYYAQGGIAAVIDKDDIPESHFEDTIIAGRGLCDHPAVKILVNEGPARIEEIIKQGMKFDITEDGELALGLEGGHHRRRILHAGGDATGRMITTFVIEEIKKKKNITIFQDCTLIDILKDDNKCDGVRCWDKKEEKEVILTANITILASGGTSAIYKRTTNPSTATGDGIAIAYKAGCSIQDIEFIQFHPTAIYQPNGEAFLVSEAVRGEGAYLLNHKGERFMFGEHELAELAPRDIVAKKIDEQIRKEGKKSIYLSLKHINPDHIKNRFPTIYQKCKELGIDMTDKIPIAPAAHYTVGGVETNDSGKSSLDNLYICGELASTGIMGANRLASNSLLECLVFGKRAIDDSLENKNIRTKDYSSILSIDHSLKSSYLDVSKKISDIMIESSGIVRTENKIKEGLDCLTKIELDLNIKDYNEIYSNHCYNLILTARLIMQAALFRKESRGGHFRADYPVEKEDFHFHVSQKQGENIKKLEVITI